MAGILLPLALSMGLLAAIWLLLAPRRKRPVAPLLPGQLSEAERRRLYERLGLDPAVMTRQGQSNVVWLEPYRARRRRSTDA